VSRCAVSLNANFGISAANSSTIRENNCHSNTQFSGNSSGILVGGSDNRIENNNAAINNTGIRVTAAGNLIIGNSCSGNTIVNYDIASNNRYGVVINLTAGGTASVSGSAAAGTLNTSNEPWANFAY
jgi:parallel beta-helix repeat protein